MGSIRINLAGMLHHKSAGASGRDDMGARNIFGLQPFDEAIAQRNGAMQDAGADAVGRIPSEQLGWLA